MSANDIKLLTQNLEWRWRHRGKNTGHLFDRRKTRPNSICGQIWSHSWQDTDTDWYAPMAPSAGSNTCSKCNRTYEKYFAEASLFDEKVERIRFLALEGAPTPANKPEPFRLTDEQRALVAVEYETQLALNMAKTGKPTQANARAVLMAAARWAAGYQAGMQFVNAAAESEIERLQNERDELRACLHWYVENDDTNDAEYNAPWLKGKRRAMKALGMKVDE